MEKAGNSTLQTLSQLSEIRTKRELVTKEIDELINIAFRLERSVSVQSDINLTEFFDDIVPTVSVTCENGGAPPQRMTNGAAGFDMISREDIVLKPGYTTLVSTGNKLSIPEGYVGILTSRSSLGVKKGIVIAQGVGTIDSDYRGEIMVPLFNRGNENFDVKKGDRVAQIIFMPVLTNMRVTDKLDFTERGAAGFGSTGISTDTTKTSEKDRTGTSSMDVPVTC